MSPLILPRNVETASFSFCLDTKWQNIAPVGWFNSNNQASLPCQRANWKWQSLFGFNQKHQHFQCDISDWKVCELRVRFGWRGGWFVGCHLECFLCILLIVFSFWRKRRWGKDRHSLLPLSSGIWDLQAPWQMSVTWGDPTGSDALVLILPRNFSQEDSGAEGTYSPRSLSLLRAGEGCASHGPTNLFYSFSIRLGPVL